MVVMVTLTVMVIVTVMDMVILTLMAMVMVIVTIIVMFILLLILMVMVSHGNHWEKMGIKLIATVNFTVIFFYHARKIQTNV